MNQDLYWAAHIKRVALLILTGAQRDGATDFVIATIRGAASIRCKIDGAWHDCQGSCSDILPDIVAELGQLAGFREGPFPKTGTIEVPYSGLRLRWVMQMTSADAECILTPIRE